MYIGQGDTGHASRFDGAFHCRRSASVVTVAGADAPPVARTLELGFVRTGCASYASLRERGSSRLVRGGHGPAGKRSTFFHVITFYVYYIIHICNSD
jgi:hypothetical protein